MLIKIRRDDGGFALVSTLLAMTAVLGLLAGVLNYAVGSQNLSRHDQDWNAALSAAEAGIDDYLYRLNQDGSYWQYGNAVTGTASCDSAGVTPTDGNLAFTTWTPVPGATSAGSFRYDVTCRPAQTGNGSVILTATGKVRNTTRSITSTLRRRNFLDFLYFTEEETKDPAAYSGEYYSPADAQTYCAFPLHYYGPEPTTSTPTRRDISGRVDFIGDSDSGGAYCTEITFISNDAINGPLHSNDAIRINGSPDFNGPTSTSYDPCPAGTCDRWVETPAQSPNPEDPDFAFSGDPRFASALNMPPGNEELLNETNPSLTADPGCLFTGPTAIRLNGNTMDVISPFTQVTYCDWLRTPTDPMQGRTTVTTFTLPPEGGVVYVQNVATSGDNGEPETCPFDQGAIGGNGGSGLTPTRSHPLGFPQKNDITPTSTGELVNGYGCRNGDAFVQGELDGRLTIAAQNNIVLVGSTTYEGGDDLLGLVANNYINVYHPVSDSTGEAASEVQSITLTGWDTPGVNEVQTLTLNWQWGSGDSFRLRFNGDNTNTINYNSSDTTLAGTIRSFLEFYTDINAGDIQVDVVGLHQFAITFGGQYTNINVNQISFRNVSGFSWSVSSAPQGAAGDQFRLTFNGAQTGPLVYGAASAADVQAALEALWNINPGDVVVTGAEPGPYTVTFGGQYAEEDVSLLQISCTGCTGAVTTVQGGGAGSGVPCDGAFNGSYCSLRVPGESTSSTTPSLFTGSGLSTATGQYANRAPSVSAALLTVAHSFQVQNYRYGPPFSSPLTVVGAIAQQYRGAVGTFYSSGSIASGYAKAYSYDNRLEYDSPPKFLNPVKSQWQVVTWAEQPAVHDADDP